MLLLIPGPVSTHPAVRQAMAADFAPWDRTFRSIYADVLSRLLMIAGGDEGEHVVLPLQGSGHFMVEAVLRTFLPHHGKVLVPITGVYGQRIARLARESGHHVVPLAVPPKSRISSHDITTACNTDPQISHVAFVYSETGTGVIHNAPEISAAARLAGRRVIVDAISAFGAFPLDIKDHPEIDAVIFTPNKCLESVSGVSFAVARQDRLTECRQNAKSFCMDLSDVHAYAKRWGAGFSRFTPPTQIIAALAVALGLYEREGQSARLSRYNENLKILYDGVVDLGLVPWLERPVQGPVVVNVVAPAHACWNLARFVDLLREKEILISDFHYTAEPSFRVGCIGAITPAAVSRAVQEIGNALVRMGIRT